jgi:DNA primase catalytic core
MSNITNFINYELYPAVFQSADSVFTDHNFILKGGNYQSKTYLTGTLHKSNPAKTVITKRQPTRILEQGGDSKTLIDYVMDRDGIEFIEAVQWLAKSVNLEVPKGDNHDKEKYQKQQRRLSLLEEANKYFIDNLTGLQAGGALDYLKNVRGYSDEEIKTAQFGFIPSKLELYNYLKGKGFQDEEMKNNLLFNNSIGSTHNLSIPYRVGADIKGFKFRTLGDSKPKYMNTGNFEGQNMRNEGFFNIKAVKEDKDLTIVEGEFDAITAELKGVKNIVATGGASINETQVQDAIKRGAKRFTICFDYDKGKEVDTQSKILKAIEVFTSLKVSNVYIAQLPNDSASVDADEYIKSEGKEAFQSVLDNALPYYTYQLNAVLNNYDLSREQTAKELDSLYDEIIIIYNGLTREIDELNFSEILTTEVSETLTKDFLDNRKGAIQKELEVKRIERERTKLVKDHKEQLSGVTDLSKIESINNDFAKKSKALQPLDKFQELFKTDKREDLLSLLSEVKEGLQTGYTIGGTKLELPSGALSVFCAPTSHGKTALLVNTMLRVIERYPTKQFYFFSYEESKAPVLMRVINAHVGKKLTAKMIGGDLGASKEKVNELFSLIEEKRLSIEYVDYGINDLCTAIQYLKDNEPNVGGIFVDYFQLLTTDNNKSDSRQGELKEICHKLKNTANDTGIPIILASQFNRKVNNLSTIHSTNISEAGDIERIANVIVGMWNTNFSRLNEKDDKQALESLGIDEIENNQMYMKILKNRGGIVGDEGFLSFDGNTGVIK